MRTDKNWEQVKKHLVSPYVLLNDKKEVLDKNDDFDKLKAVCNKNNINLLEKICEVSNSPLNITTGDVNSNDVKQIYVQPNSYYRVYQSEVRNDQNEPLRLFQLHVTERDALVNLSDILDTQNEMVCRCRPDMTIIYANKSYATFFGKTKDEIIGLKITDLIEVSEVQKVQADIEKAILNGFSGPSEYQAKSRSGDRLWLEWTHRLISEPNHNPIIQSLGYDITIRKVHEEKSQSSQKAFNMMLAAFPDLFFIMDKNGYYRYVHAPNPADLFKPKIEIVGKHVTEVLPDNLAKMVLENLQKTLSTETDTIFVYPLKVGGGENWYEARILFSKEDAIVSIVRDITSLVQTKKELEKTKEFLEQSAGLAKVGGWEVDVETGRVYWTQITADIHEEVGPLERSVTDGINYYKEGESRKIIQQAAHRALKYGEPYDLELQIVTAKGNEKWVRTKANTVFENGKCFRFYGIFQDITERKNTELELNKLYKLESVLTEIVLEFINLKPNELDTGINKALEKIGLFVKADRVYIFDYDWVNATATNSYEWCADGISPEINNLQNVPIDTWSFWKEKHKNGEVVIIEEVNSLSNLEMRNVLHSQGIISLVAIPVMDGNTCIGCIGFDSCKQYKKFSESELNILKVFAEMVMNVRKRARLEQSLIQAKNEAERANKVKGAFLSNMSHEIRTPLNSILGYSDLLHQSNLSNQQKKFNENIQSATATLLSFANNILDFSRLEAGTVNLLLSTIEIKDLFSELSVLFQNKLIEKNLELIIEPQLDMPCEFVTDGILLKQILINILDNAIKYTNEGHIELNVKSELLEQRDIEIIFEIKDTGIGIPDHLKESLFQPFMQAETTSANRRLGTGLGLAISQKIARNLGASIGFESIEGNGSIFWLKLPVEVPNDVPFEIPTIRNIKNVYLYTESELLTDYIAKWLVRTGIKVVTSHQAERETIPRLLKPGDFVMLDVRNLNMLNNLVDKEKIIIVDYPVRIDSNIWNDVAGIVPKPVLLSNLYKLLGEIDTSGEHRDILESDMPKQDNIKNYTFLIAEDMVLNMTLLKALINKFYPGSAIIEAQNGQEAIDLYIKYKPDLILMDLRMPVCDGYEATKKIRKLDAANDLKTPIIAITANVTQEDEEKATRLGMDAFLNKPFTQEEIKTTIENVLG